MYGQVCIRQRLTASGKRTLDRIHRDFKYGGRNTLSPRAKASSQTLSKLRPEPPQIALKHLNENNQTILRTDACTKIHSRP